jgi:hypothetical protein
MLRVNGGNFKVTIQHYCVLRYQWFAICGKDRAFGNSAKNKSLFHEEIKSKLIR